MKTILLTAAALLSSNAIAMSQEQMDQQFNDIMINTTKLNSEMEVYNIAAANDAAARNRNIKANTASYLVQLGAETGVDYSVDPTYAMYFEENAIEAYAGE